LFILDFFLNISGFSIVNFQICSILIYNFFLKSRVVWLTPAKRKSCR